MTDQEDKNAPTAPAASPSSTLYSPSDDDEGPGDNLPGPATASVPLRTRTAILLENAHLRAALALLPGAADVDPEAIVRDAKIWTSSLSEAVTNLQREVEALRVQVSAGYTERSELLATITSMSMVKQSTGTLDKRETFAAFVLMGLASRLQPVHATKQSEQRVVVELAFKMADLAIEQCKSSQG